jgi:hypothetical protein
MHPSHSLPLVALSVLVLGCGGLIETSTSALGDASGADAPWVTDSTASFDGDAGEASVDRPDVDAAPRCGPLTCDGGCCDADGGCIRGCAGKDWQCCLAPFDGCVLGVLCLMKDRACRPETCHTGCCRRRGNDVYCHDGLSDQACGIGGQLCEDCTVAGTTCTSDHVCGQLTCNPSTCATGCCLGNQCVSGTALLSCGAGGAQCRDCSTTNETCQRTMGGGACRPPLCNPLSCNGCCQGDFCATGAQDIACGRSGATCTSCVTQGLTCQDGGCR